MGRFLIIENVKILVVDDDTQVCDLTVTALTYCVNRQVLSFENAKQAWNYIEEGGSVDMVISDVEMPGMNGFELLKKVREKYPDKIFILTSGVPDYEKKSRVAGADAFLAKPYEINDLFSIVQCYIVD